MRNKAQRGEDVLLGTMREGGGCMFSSGSRRVAAVETSGDGGGHRGRGLSGGGRMGGRGRERRRGRERGRKRGSEREGGGWPNVSLEDVESKEELLTEERGA